MLQDAFVFEATLSLFYKSVKNLMNRTLNLRVEQKEPEQFVLTEKCIRSKSDLGRRRELGPGGDAQP